MTKDKVESLWKSQSQPSGPKAGSVELCGEQVPCVTAWLKHSGDQGHSLLSHFIEDGIVLVFEIFKGTLKYSV